MYWTMPSELRRHRTQPDLHARLARQALERNKDVFVEKPLALHDEELDEGVNDAVANSTGR